MASGLTAGAVGIVIVAAAANLPEAAGQSFGPGFFPSLIGKALIIAGLVLAIRAWRDKRLLTGSGASAAVGWIGSALVVGALLAYVLLADWLGFHLTAILCIAPVMWLFTRRLVMSIAITAIGAVCVHAAFYSLLRVPLPWGVLQPIGW